MMMIPQGSQYNRAYHCFQHKITVSIYKIVHLLVNYYKLIPYQLDLLCPLCLISRTVQSFTLSVINV